jgi:D-alanyl-lipoteichoic acid acyltransferase DltB (MBOAT superfamily)
VYPTTLASIPDYFSRLGTFLWQPIAETAWGDWRDFWLLQICDDRFLVCYCLPLGLILLLFSRRNLRVAIVATGLAFLAYVFGAFYAALWLAMCAAFYRVSERFAIEAKRTDVVRWGPPLAAITIITVWYLLVQALAVAQLPATLNNWLHDHAPWIFPLGTRGFAWEPRLFNPFTVNNTTADPPASLLPAIFWNVHNIGVAYFVVRMLHYFSELKRDTIPRARRSLLNFLAYLCYAPNLMQGPIERYPRFLDEIDTCHERRSWRNVPPALIRIGWGVLKSLIATFYFLPTVVVYLVPGDWLPIETPDYYDNPKTIDSYAFLYFGIYFHIFWLYLEFSGYCDISAGIARLLGYRQVENFNVPWIATSLRDFWRRWHISLSQLLRDYIYIPMGGNRRHVTLNLVVTFGLIGIWHVVEMRMLLWGVTMGLMLAVNQAWVRWMKKLDETPTGTLPAIRRAVVRLRPLPTIVSWAITMHFFVHSLLIFFGGKGALKVTWELIHRPFAALFAS